MTTDPDDAAGPAAREGKWWQDAVFYQVYPRSFADGNGDGIGDLVGLRNRIEHLSWLGIDAVWLSPIYSSPMHDYGYDVIDHCDVDPTYGTLDDFDQVLDGLHDEGIRLILDWVGNHVSIEHPWFVEAAASRDAARRDWFVWRDGHPGELPNNWRAAFGTPAWSWHDGAQQWYLHYFLPTQPDLNWENPDLRAAMLDTMRFWLDRGVDGFRLDVPHCFGKDQTFADHPPELAAHRQSMLNDRDETFPHLARVRQVLDGYEGRMTVGEVNLLRIQQLRRYVGSQAFDLVFNFPAMRASWDAKSWHEVIRETEETFGDGWPTWFLSNHDHGRHRSRYGGREAVARSAAVLLLTLRGTPFLFAGEELGLLDAEIDEATRVDPGGRDGGRAPIPWEDGEGHGWTASRWLQLPPEADRRNAAAARRNLDSVLHLYRRVLAYRKQSSALRAGSIELLETPDEVLGYRRVTADQELTVLINMSPHPVDIPNMSGRVDLSTDRSHEAVAFPGRLAPDEAVVLSGTGSGR